MGRLIDADKLKVYLQEYLHYGHAIPWVDAQPTAYDVENVIEEIHNYFCKIIDDYNTENIPDEILKYNKEICNIVKRGGVND